MIILAIAINKFCEIIILAILVRSILSWFVKVPYGPIYSFYRLLSQLTDILIDPCRKLLMRIGFNSGTVDFSPMVAILLIWLIQDVLVRLIAL